MVARQSGHFFFEPLDYDHVNQATNEYKEAVKVGYNLKRKMILIFHLGAGADDPSRQPDDVSASSNRRRIARH